MADKIIWDDERPDAGIVWDDAPEVAAKGNGQASASPTIPENTLEQEIRRQGGLFLRAALNAAASPAVLIDKAQAKVSDAVTGKHLGGSLGEDLNARLTGLGLPEAERPVERFTQGMAESAPAFALPASLPAQMLGNAAIGAVQARSGEEGTGAALGAAGGAAVPVLGKTLQLAGRGAAHILGATTGAGGESVRQAFRNAPGFVENMRGHVAPGTVVDNARSGIQTMRQNMLDDYRTGKDAWASDTTPLKFDDIGNAYHDAVSKFSFRGEMQPGIAEVKDKVGSLIYRWKELGADNPAFFTTEGLDALKRQLNDVYPTDIQNRTGRAFVKEVVDSVKASITRQRPDYKAAMHDYWQRSEQLDEIERSLSLGDKATVDTALRKLQSVMRNNVNSNFGQRAQSVQALEQMGGANVLPQVAGQALNSLTPRGLQGAVGIGGSIVNPAAIKMLPLMSPRLVGESARAAGMVANNPRTAAIIEALRKTAPTAVRNLNNESDR